MYIIIVNYELVIPIIKLIITNAFQADAVVGGVVGKFIIGTVKFNPVNELIVVIKNIKYLNTKISDILNINIKNITILHFELFSRYLSTNIPNI